MTPRNTRTGEVMERMVLPALQMGGYTVTRQKTIGTRFGVSKHNVDTFAIDHFGRPYLISLKWQQVSGTAEQKIPFEVVCLADAMMRNEEFFKAYLVLGGEGWRFKEFYLSGGLNTFLINADLVSIVSLERFVELANQGRL
ncbi:MAG: hypothetical protein F4X40_06350 [Chloroflexi bacterium]|nr:hypothetical protein [Chloroflexota bacterium]